VSIVGTLTWFGGLAIAILSFLLGKIFSQSEKVLDQKRKAYEAFLSVCPSPNEAHQEVDLTIEFQRKLGILSIYGSAEVVTHAGKYLESFDVTQEQLVDVIEAGHPAFLKLMTDYNRMVWAMRTDAMSWSIFAPTKNARNFKSSILAEEPKK